MNKKQEALLKILISKSIPVPEQEFDMTTGIDEPSDQYIVDGQAFREYLRSHRLNYSTINKHKDWKPSFHWNGKEESEKIEKQITEQREQEMAFPWYMIVISILAIVIAVFLNS